MTLGTQLIGDLYECSAELLNDVGRVEEILLGAARIVNATILSTSFHSFTPQGVSGVVVIAESHLAIHTWPEHGYAAVDVFTCGNLDYKRALDFIKASFEAGKCDLHKVYRGSSSRLEVCYAGTGVG